jgi:alpha-L-fucosidase
MWLGGYKAERHDLYFGASAKEVASATKEASVFRKTFRGAENIFDPGELQRGKTYFWRVDAIRGRETIKGETWKFTVQGSLGTGDYEPTWESLKSAPVPEWILDAKFGVYTHWGVYSVPAFQTNVYGSEMYVPEGAKKQPKRGMAVRRHHEANYGSIFEFGYKDFVPMFTAPKFDPAEWAQVMRDGGVRFAGICLVHHDGFCLWDSAFTRWDSMDMGPKRDIYGELAREIRKQGMRLLATFHHARTYGHHSRYAHQFTEEQKAKLDLFDPQYNDFYRNPATVSKEEFGAEWQNKISEVIRKYQPDAIWFDGLRSQLDQGVVDEAKLLRCIADYYRTGTPYVDHPIIMNKLPSGRAWNFPIGFGLRCYENGRDMEADVRGQWLIDRAIGYPWTWVKDKTYPQDSSYHIVSLCDLVSRGGILLLSLTPKGDGSIPAEEARIMREIGDWLKVVGEGIYGTRPWKTVAEGIDVGQIRTAAADPKRRGEFKASWKFQALEASRGQAVRFTRSKDFSSLYAFVIGVPESGQVTIETLRKGNVEKNGRGIRSVSMLGSPERIDWRQTGEGLTIAFPKALPCEVACGFKIKVNGRLDDSPREQFDDGIKRKGTWPVYNSAR